MSHSRIVLLSFTLSSVFLNACGGEVETNDRSLSVNSETELVASPPSEPAPWCPFTEDKNELINVKDAQFGAIGKDGGDDTEALKSAIAYAVTRSAQQLCTMIYIPSGTYVVNKGLGVVPSHTMIYGDGETSIIKRKSCPEAKQDNDHDGKLDDNTKCNQFTPFPSPDSVSYGRTFLVIDDSHDVLIKKMTFNFNYTLGNFNAITFRRNGSSNVTFTENHFTDTDLNPDISNDKHGITLSAKYSRSSDIFVTNNIADGEMQLTGGGGLGLSNVKISGNTVTNGKSFSIAITYDADDAVFDNIEISDNIIIAPKSYGIEIGPDNGWIPPEGNVEGHWVANRGIMTNIRILRNQITLSDNVWDMKDQQHTGIFVMANQGKTQFVTITGNKNFGPPENKNAPNLNTGIRLDSNRFPNDFVACADQVTFNCPDSVHWIETVYMDHNIIQNVNYGIDVAGVRNSSIYLNTITDSSSAGIRVKNTMNLGFNSNVVEANRVGFMINANRALRLSGNTVTNSHYFQGQRNYLKNAVGVSIILPDLNASGKPSTTSMKTATTLLDFNTITDTRPYISNPDPKLQKTQEYALRQAWQGSNSFTNSGYAYSTAICRNSFGGNKLGEVSILVDKVLDSCFFVLD